MSGRFRAAALVLAGALFLVVAPVLAADEVAAGMEWGQMLMGLFGGLPKPEFERLVARVLAHQSERIAIDNAAHLETVRMEMGLVHSLREIFSLARRTAKSALPAPLAAAA